MTTTALAPKRRTDNRPCKGPWEGTLGSCTRKSSSNDPFGEVDLSPELSSDDPFAAKPKGGGLLSKLTKKEVKNAEKFLEEDSTGWFGELIDPDNYTEKEVAAEISSIQSNIDTIQAIKDGKITPQLAEDWSLTPTSKGGWEESGKFIEIDDTGIDTWRAYKEEYDTALSVRQKLGLKRKGKASRKILDQLNAELNGKLYGNLDSPHNSDSVNADAKPRRRKKGCNDDCECEPCQKARKDALDAMLKDHIDVLTVKLDAKTGTPCNNQRGWVGTKPGCKRAKPGTAARVRRVERKRRGKNPEPPKARTITAAEKAERRGQLSLFPDDKPQPVRSQKNAAKRMGQGGATLKIKEPPAEVIKAAKKKAAAGERKNLTNEFNQKIKAVRAIEDPDERARQARELAMEAEKLESRWGRDQGLSSIRKKAANLSREMFKRTKAPQPKRANMPVRLSKKQGESTLFRGPNGSYFSIDSREWDAAVDALAKVDGNYTKPQIRERLKNKIKAGSKGGPAGRWSARKSQLLANEYKKAGGGYRGPRTQEQKSQANWNDEDWDYVTPDDKKKPRAERGRYLPKAARENLTAGEKRATNAAKRKATQSGEPSSAQPERIAQKTAKYRSDAQGTLISTLPRRNGKVKYRGQWWTIDKDIAATQKGKKRQVLAKKGDRVMLIAFGDDSYRHNYSPEAKANYLNRSAGIRDKDGNLTKDDPWSPNYWSRKVLWPKGDAA